MNWLIRNCSDTQKNNKNCYFVTGEKLYANPDGIHINAESQRRFGIRYFEAYQTEIEYDIIH